eukprot:5337765-Pyramimonas_sp.AAC.1
MGHNCYSYHRRDFYCVRNDDKFYHCFEFYHASHYHWNTTGTTSTTMTTITVTSTIQPVRSPYCHPRLQVPLQ